MNAKALLGYDWALLHILLWLKFALMRAQWPTLWRWIAVVGRASNLLTSARTEMCACPGSVQQRRHTLLFLVFYFWCTRYGMRYSQWELLYHISGMAALRSMSHLKCCRIKICNGVWIALTTVGCQYLLPLYSTNMQKGQTKTRCPFRTKTATRKPTEKVMQKGQRQSARKKVAQPRTG